MTKQLNTNKKIKSSEPGKLKGGVFLRALILKNQSVLGRWSHNKLEGAQEEKHCLSGCRHIRDAARVPPGSPLA